MIEKGRVDKTIVGIPIAVLLIAGVLLVSTGANQNVIQIGNLMIGAGVALGVRRSPWRTGSARG